VYIVLFSDGVKERLRVGERISLYDDIEEDIDFVTEKIKLLKKNAGKNELNIKQMADIHRYAETRLFLVRTQNYLELD
jgi:hypothetical protein